ncbi:N-lysine methyltransferase KMT5A isoform X2 [Lissotriton helveticus]
MSKSKEGKTEEVSESQRGGGTNENHPKMKGDIVFIGQSKIYTYMSPTKSPNVRPPLQEENSANPYEVKCAGKAIIEAHRKAEEKRNACNTAELAMKSIDKEVCNSSEPMHNGQKGTSTEKQVDVALPPVVKISAVPATSIKAKPASTARRKLPVSSSRVQGRHSQNRKVTDYFPVRRSGRKSKAELQCEEKLRIDELIKSGKEEGMKIDFIDGKGRGVFATRDFIRGEFVVEYHGDLIEITDAKKREALYAQDSSTGCYMYYFQYRSKTYCVDATRETNRLGRLINHSKAGNCHTKLHDINTVPHLILIASRDIQAGEELLYDYGDRSKASIEAHPWLKK